MPIGENIKKYRNNLELTQKQLAEKASLSESAIKYYESNRRNPKFDTIKKIAAALGVPINNLLSSEDTFSLDLLSCVQRAYRNYSNSFPNELHLTSILIDDCGFSEKRASEVVYDQASFIVDEIEKIISYINEIDPNTYNDFLKETDREEVIVLGQKIALHRIRNSFSVSELCNLCDIKSSYLERLEKGYVTYPSKEILKSLATALGVTFSTFLITKEELENIDNPNFTKLPALDNEEILSKQQCLLLKPQLIKYLNFCGIPTDILPSLCDEIMDYIELRVKRISKNEQNK